MTLRELDASCYNSTLKMLLEKTRKYVLRDCVYMLDFGTHGGLCYYKFGKTSNILDRMKTHFRRHQFYDIVGVWIVDDMTSAENRIKLRAKTYGELVTKFGETEIIATTDISKYTVDFDVGGEQSEGSDREDEVVETIKETIKETTREVTTVTTANVRNKIKFSCTLCGKKFIDNAHLKKHMNRKKPCYVQAIPEGDENNPLRCNWCNNVFSHNSNLVRHKKTCKYTKPDKIHAATASKPPTKQIQPNKELEDLRKQVAALTQLVLLKK